MGFWVRRTQPTAFYITDLGDKGIAASGGEADLHESFSYDEIQSSLSLSAAFASADLVKLDGPGGSPVVAGTEYDDAVMAHAINATDIHTGILDITQLEWRQLTYFMDEGPAEGFLSGAYKEITGGVFPTLVIWYDNNGVGKKKIVEKTINRNANQTPSTIVWKIYDASEVLIRTITDTFTYSSGVFESSRLRTVV